MTLGPIFKSLSAPLYLALIHPPYPPCSPLPLPTTFPAARLLLPCPPQIGTPNLRNLDPFLMLDELKLPAHR